MHYANVGHVCKMAVTRLRGSPQRFSLTKQFDAMTDSYMLVNRGS